MVILGTLALVFGLLISLMTSSFWGEMAGIARGGDKSGLGGLVWVLLFMGIRWTAVLVALAAAVSTGAFESLVSNRWAQYGLVLGIHLALGLVSMYGFNWISDGLSRDEMGPQRLSWFFGVVLPLPAFLAAGWGLRGGWLARHPRMTAALLLGLLALHLLPYRHRLLDMRVSAERVRGIRAAEGAAEPEPGPPASATPD
jgi:hypothetical protein